jgi:GT2 family glycosyltransferase
MPSIPAVRVVVLAYGDEPYLGAAVASALASEGVAVSVRVVDNGCTSDAVRDLPDDPRISIVTPSENLGFAGGVNLGAADLDTEFLTLLNSDAELAPDALRHLVARAAADGVGIATPSLRLADDPERLNSAGNPLHFTALSWAGAYGELASEHAVAADVACCTGAGATMQASWWREVEGFDDTFFAYHEDVDLSWRTWMLGRRVVFEPLAVVSHHYEFSRNALKLYLIERNRVIVQQTLFGARMRAWQWLPGTALDVAMGLLARKQGWADEKARATRWVRDNRDYIERRREHWQSRRVRSDRELAPLLTATLDASMIPLPRITGVLNVVSRAYWSVARRFV